jgi:UDP:flavonoid glycosyltransferase YjiC (YdhE family)
MLALGQRLARRGHDVSVLGTAAQADQFARAGLKFTAFERVQEFEAGAGSAIEDQTEAFFRHLAGAELSDEVGAAIDSCRPNVIVIDCMQLAAFSAAEARSIATIALVHYLPIFAAGSRLSAAIPILNQSRAALGLRPLDEALGIYEQLWPRCDRVLAATLQRLDDLPGSPPENLHYVGPIFGPDRTDWEWDLPWSTDHRDPLVVVSFSTTYQHQEQQLQRAVDALAQLPVRVLVTLGPGLEPADIEAPAGTAVRQWIPHAAVLPHATLLITHAGHSTIMNAINCAVPMVCLPTGRDQLINARRVKACGLGIALEPDATTAQIRAAASRVLAEPAYSLAIEEMASALRQLCATDPAVSEVEALISR